jgi:hypothetical protein
MIDNVRSTAAMHSTCGLGINPQGYHDKALN